MSLSSETLLARVRERDLEETLQRVARAHGVDALAILSPTRDKRVARARVALYSALRDAGLTWPSIAALTGRDEQSVRGAVRYWLDDERREKTRARARERHRRCA